MKWYYYALIIYAVVINIFAVCITIYDKKAAKKHRRRIPESTLLFTAAVSGCIAVYLTMLLIHHKTKHLKFMAGIPIIFITECAAAVGIMFLTGVVK